MKLNNFAMLVAAVVVGGIIADMIDDTGAIKRITG